MALNLTYQHEEHGAYIGCGRSLVVVENLEDNTWATYIVQHLSGKLEEVQDGKTGMTKKEAFRDLASKRGC